MTHTHDLIEAKISMKARKEKIKKKEHLEQLVLDNFSGVSFSLLFS